MKGVARGGVRSWPESGLPDPEATAVVAPVIVSFEPVGGGAGVFL